MKLISNSLAILVAVSAGFGTAASSASCHVAVWSALSYFKVTSRITSAASSDNTAMVITVQTRMLP